MRLYRPFSRALLALVCQTIPWYFQFASNLQPNALSKRSMLVGTIAADERPHTDVRTELDSHERRGVPGRPGRTKKSRAAAPRTKMIDSCTCGGGWLRESHYDTGP